MSWFQLDSESVCQRVRATACPTVILGLRATVARAVIGFTILSLVGFAPWALFGRWFYHTMGEGGLYGVCAAAFIGCSGPLLHRLILGPGSLPRFYKIFAISFMANSVLWVAGWMSLRGHIGSVAGLLMGTAAMGWILVIAFDARSAAFKTIAALFVLNSAGYFIGGVAEGALAGSTQVSLFGHELSKKAQTIFAKMLWGIFYGVGFGAGLGLALYYCQERTRAALTLLQLEKRSSS